MSSVLQNQEFLKIHLLLPEEILMSSHVGTQLDDIAKYIDRLKEQKRNTEKCIQDLEKDRTTVEERIEELRRRKDELDDRLRMENERLQRQERTIHQGEVTYAKLLESSQSLVDFMRKEYQDTRRQ